MFSQNIGGPQTGDQFTTSAVNQQANNLLGNPPVQTAAMPAFDPSALNTTAISSASPNVLSMVNALKGSV